MTDPILPDDAIRRLARPLRLTQAGLVVEHGLAAFWPLLTALLALGALLLSGALGCSVR